VFAQGILRNLAPDQRIAHLRCAVAHAVRGSNRELRLYEAIFQLTRLGVDAGLESLVDRLDLGGQAQIALAVALGANHADRRLMDKGRIGSDFDGKADGLGRSAGVIVNQDGIWIGHGDLFSVAGLWAGGRIIGRFLELRCEIYESKDRQAM
jgi:hypothetical protein